MNQNPPASPLHIGWRTIKTAVAATLVAMAYCAAGRNPAFACIGVIFGIGADMQDSIKNGGNRLFGTLIGGLLSIAVFRLYLIFFPHGGHTVWLALFLGLGRGADPAVPGLLAGRCAAGRRGALHRFVQHAGGKLCQLRAEPHF